MCTISRGAQPSHHGPELVGGRGRVSARTRVKFEGCLYNRGFCNLTAGPFDMPIYAYKCESCGFAKDVLQKISDAPLVDCPACAAPAFKKQLTAAGFQLKGSGWYATDFKGGSAPATGDAPASTETKPADSAPATVETAVARPETSSTKPAAAGCGGGCSCH